MPDVEFLQDAAVRMGYASGAAALTWALVNSGLTPVAASSIVGLAAGRYCRLPSRATSAFAGTFAGMSSLTVAPGPLNAAGLGAAGAALLAALDASDTRFLKGYGGRLGTAVTLAGLATVAATPSLRAAGLLVQPELATAAAVPSNVIPTVAATLAGSFAMRLWARRLAFFFLLGSSASIPSIRPKRAVLARKLVNPVASASIVGLVASVMSGPGSALPASAFAGAFVAMSAPPKLRNKRGLLLAAVAAGFAQVALSAVGVGVGGKLGAAASIGVFLTRQLRAAAAVILLLVARSELGDPSKDDAGAALRP